jgi:hypothetical protein
MASCLALSFTLSVSNRPYRLNQFWPEDVTKPSAIISPDAMADVGQGSRS